MAIAPVQFQNAQAYSDLGLMPLGKLGRALGNQPTLSDLGNRYADPSTSAAPSAAAAPITGGTSAPFAAPPTSGDVNAAIRASAGTAGMDPAYWKAVASIESSLNPSSNYDKKTQYKGLFQIGGDEWSRHGKGDIYNAGDNATAAASLAAANNAAFKNQFGRDPTPTETYMMHQQGLGFYTNGTMTNVQGNPYPGMSGPQTPQSFEEGWGREIERRAKYFRGTGDDSADQGGG
jgi:hypothetical protein